MGAEFLTAVGAVECGGWYYEVEVLEAEGGLYVGFAGTNLGPQCTVVGDDAHSWGLYMGGGWGRHGYVRGRSKSGKEAYCLGLGVGW